jgi:SAM-dependent methyltransferase
MGKQGEIEYLSRLGKPGRRHVLHKPFSDPHCGGYLMRMGSVMDLLPPPPARVLDLGCGAGWTSEFLGRRGHRVVGVDIAADLIAAAEARRQDNVSFLVSDFESLPFRDEFDAALFFDALHHAVDEEAALAAAFRALKPGGLCVASEPGAGHSRSEDARTAVARFGVTEKDMPPGKVIRLGRRVGFRASHVYPHAHEVGSVLYGSRSRVLGRWEWLRRLSGLAMLAGVHCVRPLVAGTVVLVK